MTGRRAQPADDGFATIWAAGAVAVLLGLMVIGIELGSAVAGRHRAEAAADLAALAAAGHAVHGEGPACARAGGIANQMGGLVRSCRLDGWDALVEVDVELHLAVVGRTAASGRARAGPVDGPAPAAGAPATGVVRTGAPETATSEAVPRPGEPATPDAPPRTPNGRTGPASGPGRRREVTGSVRTRRGGRSRPDRTLVVADPPIGDGRWRRRAGACLLVAQRLTASHRAVAPSSLPALRMDRRVDGRHSRPGPPRSGRCRPARPPDGPAGSGPLLPGRTQGVEHDAEHRHRTRLVERRVAVAALG